MEMLATIPLVVGAIENVATMALQALAERLLVMALAALLVGGVAVFAATAFSWLWLKRVVGDLHAPLRPAHH